MRLSIYLGGRERGRRRRRGGREGMTCPLFSLSLPPPNPLSSSSGRREAEAEGKGGGERGEERREGGREEGRPILSSSLVLPPSIMYNSASLYASMVPPSLLCPLSLPLTPSSPPLYFFSSLAIHPLEWRRKFDVRTKPKAPVIKL